LNAPQIIYVVLVTMGLTLTLVRDGQPKTGKESFLASLISNVLILLLLWWGGFFGGGQ